MHAYTCACLAAHIHTYVNALINATYININVCLPAYNMYMCTLIHTYLHTYINAYLSTDSWMCVDALIHMSRK